MKKIFTIVLILCIALACISCGEKVEPSGIDWYNKIQVEDVANSYIEDVAFDDNAAIMNNELNSLLTLVMGLREELFDFEEADFNLAMDEFVYYPESPRFSKVCKALGVEIKDWGFKD